MKLSNNSDKLAFQEQAEVPDTFLGSAKQFKTKNKPKKASIRNEGEIPLITSQNLFESEAPKKKVSPKVGSATSTSQGEVSEHKQMAKETLNWDYVTIDEGAQILKNSICYFNEERKEFKSHLKIYPFNFNHVFSFNE